MDTFAGIGGGRHQVWMACVSKGVSILLALISCFDQVLKEENLLGGKESLKAYVEERFKHISSEDPAFYNEDSSFRSRIEEALAIKNYQFFDLNVDDMKRLAEKGMRWRPPALRWSSSSCHPQMQHSEIVQWTHLRSGVLAQQIRRP